MVVLEEVHLHQAMERLQAEAEVLEVVVSEVVVAVALEVVPLPPVMEHLRDHRPIMDHHHPDHRRTMDHHREVDRRLPVMEHHREVRQ